MTNFEGGVEGQSAPVDSAPGDASEYAAQGAAKLLKLPLADARLLLEEQAKFAAVVDTLRRNHADVVSSVRWDYLQKRGVVNLVSSASAAQQKAAADLVLGSGGLVEKTGEISERERSEQSVELSARIRESHPNLSNFSVHPSDDYQSLVVEVPVDVRESVNEWASQPHGQGLVRVEMRVVDRRGGKPTAGVVGGAQLNEPIPGQPNQFYICTSAFTLLNPPASPKLLTAGHCSNNPLYGSSSYLQGATQSVGVNGDLQWHTIYNGGTALPKFQYASGLLTTNKYSSAVYNGQLINRYGRNSSETIKVDLSDSTETISGVGTLTHVAVTDRGSNVVGGDSGGPIWVGASGGASATGIQSSVIWQTIGGIQCCFRAVFTPANNLAKIWPTIYYYVG